MSNDVLLAKLAAIQRCLRRIRAVTGGDWERVVEPDVQDIVVLNLQRAIQAAIDLAAHLISTNGWALPDSLKAHFTTLTAERVVSEALARRLEAMVGFRNIAVHDYQAIDVDILKTILRERLGDLEDFGEAVKVFRAKQ